MADEASAAAEGMAEAHARLLREGRIQFDFPPMPQQKPPPDWLLELLKGLEPVFKVVFWIGVVAAVAAIVWFIGRELLRIRLRWRGKGAAGAAQEEDWRPEAAAARSLLADADALAEEGRFGEAAHLLLYRSLEDISGKKPGLIRPALTSRDIAAHDGLPGGARTAFAAIARAVELSFFGGRALDRDGFADCRQAYEAFAFPEAWR